LPRRDASAGRANRRRGNEPPQKPPEKKLTEAANVKHVTRMIRKIAIVFA
jgi:hypothetical protein